jgi:minor extracellular serine protease Vpr
VSFEEGTLKHVLSPVVFIGIVAALAVSCSQKATGPLALAPDYAAIFSTRPQSTTHAVFLLKLRRAPLLSTALLKDGKKTIDPVEATALDAEQDVLLKALAQISPDIKPLYKYRLTLNALAVVAPLAVQDKIRAVGNVVYVEAAGTFARPAEVHQEANVPAPGKFAEHNSVKFIGGEEAHALGIRGQGLRIGIIDTGIDYTHLMFGGAGTPEAYKAIDPSVANAAFPSAKVVGGFDFVGTKYNAASADFMLRIPIPDVNPLDEAGHGSHVAGTIAGHGDGVNSYDGVAPDASLFALKVFGAEGSTSDSVVIAALERAADPDGDGNIADHLDVVNLSLGGGYGDPHLLYAEAIRNLTSGGTSVVCSAGNSGDSSYIVGAPSVAEEAISIAASIDDSDANWKFQAVKFTMTGEPELFVEAIEGTITKPIKDLTADVTAPLVFAGFADKDFSDELKARLKGNIALIDRGVVAFAEKIRRAQDAGAIGIVVANNVDGEPLAMGGDGKFDIPGIMVKKELGAKLKAAGAVMSFKTDRKIEKPELIDTITGFSSKGPRSLDALVKPEIAAPGNLVVSAKMGGGAEGTMMSGTSMAAPHMTGVLALLKQAHPDLSTRELKSLAMGTAKSLVDEKNQPYPISRLGAGRIQIMRALNAKTVEYPTALSLGEVTIEAKKSMNRSVEVHNISKEPLTLTVAFEGHAGLRIQAPATVTIAAGEKAVVPLVITIDATALTAESSELDGLIKFSDASGEVLRVPVLAVANRISQLSAGKLTVRSTSEVDSQGAAVDLLLANKGRNAGDAYVFNLIGQDGRKSDPTQDASRSKACDLENSGYRVIQREGVSILQVAVKLYEPMTTWDQCEVSVLIDGDGDGIPDQELVGAKQDHLTGLTKTEFGSILIDAPLARQLRKQFEIETMAGKKDLKEDYTTSVIDLNPMLAFQHSTVAIIEVPVSKLARRPSGELAVRIATSYQEGTAIQPDDFLSKDPNHWTVLNVADLGAAYVGLPEKITLNGSENKSLSFEKGAGREKLLVVYPTNKTIVGGVDSDSQAQVLTPRFEAESSAIAVGGE